MARQTVSPGWIAETLQAMGMDPGKGLPAADLALRYKESVEGSMNGQVIAATARAA